MTKLGIRNISTNTSDKYYSPKRFWWSSSANKNYVSANNRQNINTFNGLHELNYLAFMFYLC